MRRSGRRASSGHISASSGCHSVYEDAWAAAGLAGLSASQRKKQVSSLAAGPV